jgi:hypothetical protein
MVKEAAILSWRPKASVDITCAMSILTIPTAVLRKVLSIREQIESLEADLAKIVGEPSSKPASQLAPTTKPARKRRGLSAAGRARIIAAQKARWAKVKGTATPAAPVPVAAPVKRKSKMSAAGRARIAAAQKARWAKVRAAKKK